MSIARSAFVLVVVLVTGLMLTLHRLDQQAPASSPDPAPVIETTPQDPVPEEVEVVAIGDLLMHLPVVNSCFDAASGSYEFDSLFDDIRPAIAGADYAIANLETRLAGKEKGFQGYPLFNTPDEFAPAVANLGVDLVTTANNHSLDMRYDGLVATLDCLDRNGLPSIGTYRSLEERQQPFVVPIQGIRIGFINLTATTNGLPLPPEHPYCVGLLQDTQAQEDIARVSSMNPDLIIACIHFGTEYRRDPDPLQEQWAQKLITMGVDAVIGCHPHVVEPIVWLTSNDSDQRRVPVVYSLGNFISNQRWRYSDSGIILHLNILKEPEGEASIASARYTAIWVDTYHIAGKRHYRVLPVEKAIGDYEHSRDGLLTEEDYNRLIEVREELAELLDDPANGVGPYARETLFTPEIAPISTL